MTVYFPFVYENILTAINNELSRLALMLIKVNEKKVCSLWFMVSRSLGITVLIKGILPIVGNFRPETTINYKL